jgi:uncharacterized protein DUF5662
VYRQYLAYVCRHKWFVFLEACRLGIPWRGLTHDLSKLRPSEFPQYAAYFYGGHPRDAKPPRVQAAFDRAWLLHQHRNDHHWQAWVLREDDGDMKLLPMADGARRELLADWRGAGRAITGKAGGTPAWYLKNRERILLHPKTRFWVEAMLGIRA